MRIHDRATSLFLLLALLCAPFLGCAPPETAPEEAAPRPSLPAPESAEPLPSPETKFWFLGDWAGVYEQNGKVFTDFGAALSEGVPTLCLLRIYESGGGFAATLGITEWEVFAQEENALSLRCVKGSASDDPYGIFERFSIHEGDTLHLSYEGDVESSVPMARVPTGDVMRGTSGEQLTGASLLLARLPSGAERSEESGEYPRWYGGYENMDGGFRGLFLLGENERGGRFYGAVLTTLDGGETVMDRQNFAKSIEYAPRAGESTDLLVRAFAYDVSEPWWPRFERWHLYEGERRMRYWKEVTCEHAAYFAGPYLAQLNALEAELREGEQNGWTRRRLLLIEGLRHYAALAARGELAEALYPYVEELVSLEPQYLPDASLAGIRPNDTLNDAQRLYTLWEITGEQARELGFDGVYDAYRPDSPVYGYKNYTDGNGLVLTVWADGRIAAVEVYKAGYETPDGRQVGDAFSMDTRSLRVRDAEISFGRRYPDEESGKISVIAMETVLERAFCEITLDFDGDGEAEYFTLSGRCAGSYLECGTRLGDFERGTVDENDFGTRVTLRMYKNGALTDEAVLPLHTLYLAPDFSLAREKEPGKLYIVCSTGNGTQQPAYLVEKTEDGWRAKYIGLR